MADNGSDDQWSYYNNIADCLAISKEYDLAEQYFKLTIKKIYQSLQGKDSSDHKKSFVGLFKLNYIDCLLRKGDLEKAKEIFSSINPEIEISESRKFLYLVFDIVLSINTNKNYLTSISKLKVKLFDREWFVVILSINELIISRYEGLTDSQKEKILLENIEVCSNTLNDEMCRQSRIDIIRFYISQKNQEAELIHLRELYKIDATVKKNKKGVLRDIFLQEISAFVDSLRKNNTLISSQKKELEEITYILSHDLKTPLRNISSFSELAKRKMKNEEFEEITDYLEHIEKSSKDLYALVEDVNTLHRVEQNNSKQEDIDLNDIVNKVIEQLKPYLSRRNASIELQSILPTVKGIPSNFFIVFQNIIENGLKYNESVNPKVTISTQEVNGAIHLYFKDNGLGIEEEYKDYIFLYFKRLHNKEKYEGTGFGLGICKKIINNCKGSIWVESKPGEGSTFVISLPISY